MSNELAIIKNVELVPFFTKGNAVDETLAAIEKEALAFVAGDLSVLKNRKAVTAMVTKVTDSKTYLEKNGKELAAEYKAIPKVIDATRKKTKDFLTELQAKVRLPLTEWEAEQKRIAEEEAERIAKEELAKQVELDHELGLLLNAEFDRKREEERIAEVERQRLHDEAIAKEAAAKAKREAEEAAKDKIEAAIKAEREAKEREEEQRQAAINAENKRLADIQAVKYEAERKENARIQAEEKAKREQEAEAARLAKVESDRQSNIKHRHAVHSEMKAWLVSNGVDADVATNVVMGMSNKQMPHTVVKY